jgi:hypothetical protein
MKVLKIRGKPYSLKPSCKAFTSILLLVAGISTIFTLGLNAQEMVKPVTEGMTTLNTMTSLDFYQLKTLPEDQLQAFLTLLESTPTISAAALPRHGMAGGAFFSLQNPNWPPLPGDVNGNPVWQGDGIYLLDDLGFDYRLAGQSHFHTGRRAANAGTLSTASGVHAEDDNGGGGMAPPGGESDAVTNSPDGLTYPPPNYGTNLFLALQGTSNNLTSLLISNTTADVLLELQGCTNLVSGNWFSVGFVNGSELTNCTPASVPVSQQGTLFFRIRSWMDTYDTGIPDWWWYEYFGQITNVDAYAQDPAGDGYDNLAKFDLGLNPNLYFNTNTPGGFFGALDASGTNAYLEWTPSPGPASYVIQRGVQDENGTYTYIPIGLLSSNANYFEDVGAITNANAQNNIYYLSAVYPGGCLTATDTWTLSWYDPQGSWGPPYDPPMPNNVYANVDATGTNVLISWVPIQGFVVTNYMIERGVFDAISYTYDYSPITKVSTNTTAFELVGAITNGNNWSDLYGVVAGFPDGVLSAPATSAINVGFAGGPAAPNPFYGYLDATDTNLFLTWGPAPGAVTNYLLYGGTYDGDTGGYDYVQIGRVNGGTNIFEVVGAVDAFGNNLYDLYNVTAVYPNGSLSQSAAWNPYGGTPAPGELYACLDATGTNVVLNWTPMSGDITGYIVQRSGDYGSDFSQIGQVAASTTTFADIDGANAGEAGTASLVYEVQATYSNGGLSAAVTATVSNTPPAPSGLSATVDATGTNVVLTWTPALGSVTEYIIEQGILNPATGTYSYSQIGVVGAGTTTFTATGALAKNSGSQLVYQAFAKFAGGSLSAPDFSALTDLFTQANLNVAAQLVRNGTGHWQLMFSAFPTNVQTIELDWCYYDYFYDIGTNGGLYHVEDNVDFSINFAASSITNGVYVIPDWQATNWIGDNASGPVLYVKALGANNTIGSPALAGFFPCDAPCFVDGRQHLKQNLLFELREATISQTHNPLVENGVYWDPLYFSISLPADDNYVESSFFHWSYMFKGYSSGLSEEPDYVKMDDLWPITANYEFHQNLYDTNYTGPGAFVWQTNLVTVPAPAVLGIADPYWIFQGLGNISDVAAYTNSGNLHLQNDAQNLFGLVFTTALVDTPSFQPNMLGQLEVGSLSTLAAGGSVSEANVNTFYSQTADPNLVCTNYYFAPVNTPGTALPGEVTPTQSYPLPALTGFAGTNQTGLLVASIGTPTVIGGWAKFSIENGNPAKFAYLGQYFETNAYLLNSSGNLTTNTAGVVSPYGDFFPTAPGAVAMVTMPDIDTGMQGTGVVDVISLNTDANHDGIMDFTYAGPDQTSTSRPFRFWANDDADSGDDGGDGIPGQPIPIADGYNYSELGNSLFQVHGRRDLVDFFPVYLNIGSLFQSNAWSAGISVTDTNYQFVLSQADGVLRFAFTSLTPTNYMNFLRDTNESGLLANAPLTTIPQGGVVLPQLFIGGIATSNQGIILVEAAAPTTQPLVLTIYHGTNQIAQTSLYLSISGVEQMFRSKTMMLNPASGTMPDRLTDAEVPNEPDTIAKNFVFMHGYNVNPTEARGVASDMYKRMYWSGSHAKFWAVTWEGADSKFGSVFTPNYHTNVVNAFSTAPLLANFIASLTNTGPVVAAAHSLGNMLTLSAISDWNAPISQYFMMDAAVPIEAIDPTAVTNMMVFSTWNAYSNRVFASDWYQLFPTNDNRSTLNWNNRLGNLQNVDVYNFYSSGEEVLRTSIGDPPAGVLNMVKTQLEYHFWDGFPFGTFTWYWQEKGKGTCTQDFFLGSSHGGWLFTMDPYGNPAPIPPATANALSTNTLQQTPVFTFGSRFDYVYGPFPDWALLGSGGSTYAATYRNRILSDAIPAMSLVAGANPVPKFNPTGQNVDMMTLKNNWSQGRSGNETGMWHHSDFVQMAYTFTHQLFDTFVTTGSLK